MEIVSHTQEELPPSLRAQALALQCQTWPRDRHDAPAGHDPTLEPVYVVLVDEAVVLACLVILSKTITHSGQTFGASGLSTVVTDPDRRGLGYGHRLVTAARELISARGTDLGIFTCDQHLVKFYESAGWQVLPGAVLIGGTPTAPLSSDQLDKTTLAAFFTAHARQYASTFNRARIELYPGSIDKLW